MKTSTLDLDLGKLLCAHVEEERAASVATLVVELYCEADPRINVPRRETRICYRCACTQLAALCVIDKGTSL